MGFVLCLALYRPRNKKKKKKSPGGGGNRPYGQPVATIKNANSINQKETGFILLLNLLPDNRILDWSKLKQSADDNFKFDENSRKFSKRVEDTVGKGEFARYEQFPLFPQCFQKAYFPVASKGVIVWEWVNLLYQARLHID